MDNSGIENSEDISGEESPILITKRLLKPAVSGRHIFRAGWGREP